MMAPASISGSRISINSLSSIFPLRCGHSTRPTAGSLAEAHRACPAGLTVCAEPAGKRSGAAILFALQFLRQHTQRSQQMQIDCLLAFGQPVYVVDDQQMQCPPDAVKERAEQREPAFFDYRIYQQLVVTEAGLVEVVIQFGREPFAAHGYTGCGLVAGCCPFLQNLAP